MCPHEPASESGAADLIVGRGAHPGHAEAAELHRGHLPDRHRRDRPGRYRRRAALTG